MLVGLAGGALVLGGVAVAVARSGGSSPEPLPASLPSSNASAIPSAIPSAGPTQGSGSPSSSEPRPLPLSAPDATPAWSVTVDSVPTALVASDKVVALVTEKSTSFLDSAGKPVFTPLKVGNLSSSFRALTAFADGVFYIAGVAQKGSVRTLGAVDAATGKTKWVVSVEDSAGDIRNVPAYVGVGGGKVYVGGSYAGSLESDMIGYIRAFDIATGKEQWQTKGSDINNVLVPPSGRYLLAGSGKVREKTSQVLMIDPGKGTRGWKKSVPLAHYGQAGLPLTSYADGLFICGREKVVAVDQATGEEKWHLAAGPDQPDVRFGTPIPSTDGKTVYIPVGQDLVALNAADGSVKWMAVLPEHVTFTASSGLGLGGPGALCSADTVFATDSTKTLWAIDAATGKARWKYTDPGQPDVGFTWTVGGDRAWISSNLTMTAISAHG
ncbi:outer membrane protein assembly factor BamB family protein [Streptomyces sp. H39-S7]|uniref:outer membrane protein assembly factor BamB family protein n=1 Tax=Streptomyces sp. H39-S7 TaxID=3004357 RepID=UPI0022AFCD76|nr:PQQ-binding-like beta-propeller repeat protein [Streptomyces sp. H39-S7]MCZ4125142.1 PQQ-binding-like beta-propeller repeat protein [Streptomyces sp. H39-S7]